MGTDDRELEDGRLEDGRQDMNRDQARDMRRRAAITLAAVILPIALGCVNIDVKTDYDPAHDFSSYRTYALAPEGGDPDGAVRQRVTAELTQAMAARGFEPAAKDRADLLVAFRESGRQRERIVDAGDPDTNYNILQSYTEGTLDIAIVERTTNERIWHGVGETDIVHARDIPGAAARAVSAVLRDFPPGRAAALAAARD
jgi:hypothetical protein